MEGEEEECNTRLGLAIGVGEFVANDNHPKRKNKGVACLDLTFPLQTEEEAVDGECEGSSSRTMEEEDDEQTRKRKNDSNKKKQNHCSRKKLRLTKEQSTLLEDSFKLHSTLNTVQKHALAEKLNLRPRQVEVWFQNRRARTKLKQTEVDCKFLKKCCESLSDENRRLKKELQELKSLKLEQAPLCIKIPNAPSVKMCPSCDKFVKAGDGGTGGDTKSSSTTSTTVKEVVLRKS